MARAVGEEPATSLRACSSPVLPINCGSADSRMLYGTIRIIARARNPLHPKPSPPPRRIPGRLARAVHKQSTVCTRAEMACVCSSLRWETRHTSSSRLLLRELQSTYPPRFLICRQ